MYEEASGWCWSQDKHFFLSNISMASLCLTEQGGRASKSSVSESVSGENCLLLTIQHMRHNALIIRCWYPWSLASTFSHSCTSLWASSNPGVSKSETKPASPSSSSSEQGRSSVDSPMLPIDSNFWFGSGYQASWQASVRISEGADNRGPDNRGSTVLILILILLILIPFPVTGNHTSNRTIGAGA